MRKKAFFCEILNKMSLRGGKDRRPPPSVRLWPLFPLLLLMNNNFIHFHIPSFISDGWKIKTRKMVVQKYCVFFPLSFWGKWGKTQYVWNTTKFTVRLCVIFVLNGPPPSIFYWIAYLLFCTPTYSYICFFNCSFVYVIRYGTLCTECSLNILFFFLENVKIYSGLWPLSVFQRCCVHGPVNGR